MTPQSIATRRRRSEAIAIGVVTVAGLLLRSFALGARPFWKDEFSTYGFASAPLAKFFRPEIAVETNPPVYYLLQKAWLVFGSSRLAMRSLPALLGALTIPIIYLIGRRVGGRTVGRIAALLFARHIRCYSGLTLAACTSLACLFYLMPAPAQATGIEGPASSSKRRDRICWYGYGLALAATLVLHNTGVLIVAVIGLVVAADWLLFGTFAAAFARKLALVTALATIPLLFWLPMLERQVVGDLGAPISWIGPMSVDTVYSQMLGAYSVAKYAKPLVYGFALWTAWWLLRTRHRLGLMLLVVLIGQPTLLALASFVKPMFLVRSLHWPTALFPVLMALGICQLTSSRLRSLAVAALVSIQLFSARDSYALKAEPDAADMAVRYIESESGPADVVFLVPTAWQWNYSVRNSPARELRRFTATYGDTEDQLRAWVPAELVKRERLRELARQSGGAAVWLITERTPAFPIPREDRIDPTLDALRAEGFTVREEQLGELVVDRISRGSGS